MTDTTQPTDAASTVLTIQVYDNDPVGGNLVSRPTPVLAHGPLALAIPGVPAPPPQVYPPDTAQFRYWTAAEAARRGADFWAPRVPGGKWEPAATLPILIDEGDDLNAYYDRKALNFFHGAGPGGATVYSGASADVVCHELGHAILDAIKPQLWGAASDEAAAFHESFGDMSAILSALQLQEMRQSVLAETGGHLERNSRLSRLAEQLGAAIRLIAPQAVDADCLRNAVNRFTYQDPSTLPTSAPASQLSSEAHSFSRVFTGAFLEILAGVVTQGLTAAPTEQQLLTASNVVADILVKGIKAAAVAPNFYAQVAAGMVHASQAVNPAYPDILRRIFVRRSILSLGSAADASTVQAGFAVAAMAAPGAEPAAEAPLTKLALPGRLFGLGEVAVLVEAPSGARQFSALSAAPGYGSAEAPSAEAAARAFLEGLLRRDKVHQEDLPVEATSGAGITAGAAPLTARPFHHRPKSHRLRQADHGLVLERCWFDCGLRHR
jgi:hypothetical protein